MKVIFPKRESGKIVSCDNLIMNVYIFSHLSFDTEGNNAYLGYARNARRGTKK